MKFCTKIICAFGVAFALLAPQLGLCDGVTEAYLNSTVLVTYSIDATHVSRGTGFIVLRSLPNLQNQDPSMPYTYLPLLVTNKHVLPPEHGASKITLHVAVRSDGELVETKDVDVAVLGPDGKYLPNVALHPDPDVDVAVIKVGWELGQAHADIFYRVVESHVAVLTEDLIRDTDLKDASITIGTDVFLLGYPSGMLYDARNASPILRAGIIATEPNRDYVFNEEARRYYLQHYRSAVPRKVRGFLIDANVFPGSSGSMVFRRTNIVPGFSPGGKQSIPYILGIVSMSIPIDDLQGTQRMGVGVVYNADTIRETIDKLLSLDKSLTAPQ